MRQSPETHFPSLDAGALLAVLREQTGLTELDFAEVPTPLGQGGEARVDGFRLAPAPDALARPLVLRRLSTRCDPHQVELECAVHAALADQGFPVPDVLWSDPDASALGSPYLISERLRGEALLAEVQRPDQLLAHPTRLPRLIADALFRVPKLLADVQTRLHGLDAAAFRTAVAARGIDLQRLGFADRLDAVAHSIEEHALHGLVPGLEWVRQNAREPEREAVCHGDLVFTNLCAEGGEVTGVFDWSTVLVADPAYDVAGTLIRLESRIPGVPAGLRPLFRAVQRRLGRSYRRHYERRLPIDAERLRYYDAFWTLSELSWSGALLGAGSRPTAEITGRWLHAETIDFGVERFRAATGVLLSPLREPTAPPRG